MTYRIREFARLTGVTVKALLHYDRLELLRPARTDAGYRVYSSADEARLRDIATLRSIGMPLRSIKAVLDAAVPLPEALRVQRASLEETRRRVESHIHALQRIETAEAMRGYFTDEAWVRWGRKHFEEWPGPAWQTLYRDVEAALDADPASDTAQQLLARSRDLWNADVGNDTALGKAIRQGWMAAWKARDRWPEALKQRFAAFNTGAIAGFLYDAAMADWRRRGLVETYTTGDRSVA